MGRERRDKDAPDRQWQHAEIREYKTEKNREKLQIYERNKSERREKIKASHVGNEIKCYLGSGSDVLWFHFKFD